VLTAGNAREIEPLSFEEATEAELAIDAVDHPNG
jgi:hypothetical protein